MPYFQSHIPKSFWPYAVKHAVYHTNRLPTPLLLENSHYQSLHGTLPNLTNVKVIGSLCYAITISAHRSKFDHRARKCALLGFKDWIKSYLLLDMGSNNIFPI